MKNWAEVLEKFLGSGFHPGEESDMNGHVFSAGESLNVFTPHNDANDPLVFDKSNPLWVKLNQDRSRVTVEICYCSTLGECWTFAAAVDTEQNDRGLFGRVGDYFSAIIRKVKRVQPQPEKSPWEQLTWPGFAKRMRGSGPTLIAPRS